MESGKALPDDLINSEQTYQALKSLDVPRRLVIYPGQFHGLSKPSYIQDRLDGFSGDSPRRAASSNWATSTTSSTWGEKLSSLCWISSG